MAWAARNGDAPVEAGSRDRQVRQASPDEAHHFMATAVRLDELRVRRIMRQKPVGIGGKAEEPAFLHGPFHRRALGGELCAPLSLCQFLLLVKSLVAERIPPLIAARSEEHTSELQSLMRISYAVFCLKKKT